MCRKLRPSALSILVTQGKGMGVPGMRARARACVCVCVRENSGNKKLGEVAMGMNMSVPTRARMWVSCVHLREQKKCGNARACTGNCVQVSSI